MTGDNLIKFQQRAIASIRALQKVAHEANTLAERLGLDHFATQETFQIAQALEDVALRHMDAFRAAKAEHDHMVAFGLKM